jgi:hypothetical protein
MTSPRTTPPRSLWLMPQVQVPFAGVPPDRLQACEE